MLNKNTVDFNNQISPEAFIQQIYANTAPDGTVYLNNWYDVDCKDCLTYNNFVVNIKWDIDCLKSIISEYNERYEELVAISKHYDELGASKENVSKVLNNEYLETIYYIFVAPFDAKNERELNADIVGRISEGLCGYEVIRHSQRLCKLLSLNAPQSVVQNEGRMLITSLAIHDYGKEIKKL